MAVEAHPNRQRIFLTIKIDNFLWSLPTRMRVSEQYLLRFLKIYVPVFWTGLLYGQSIRAEAVQASSYCTFIKNFYQKHFWNLALPSAQAYVQHGYTQEELLSQDVLPTQGTSFRFGLQWNVQGVYQGLLGRSQAQILCEKKVEELSFEQSMSRLELTKRREMAKASLPIWRELEQEMSRRHGQAEEELKTGQSSRHDLEAIKDVLLEARRSREQDEADLNVQSSDITAQDLHMIAGRHQDLSIASERNDQRLNRSSPWEFGLFYGQEAASRDQKWQSKPIAIAHISWKIGSLLETFASDELSSQYREWLKNDPRAMQQQLASVEVDFKARRASLPNLIRELQERVQELGELRRLNQLFKTASSPIQQLNIASKYARVASLLARAQAEQKWLDQFLNKAFLQQQLAPEKLSDAISVNEAVYRKHKVQEQVDKAKLSFILKGTSDTPRALGSGSLRHQLGIMLRRQNQCNLVYIMWRLEQRSIIVQEKYNPGQSDHEACENNGYQSIPATFSQELDSSVFDRRYELEAAIDDNRLKVWLDKKLVWEGPAPKLITKGEAIGFRSDNLRLEYQLDSHY